MRALSCGLLLVAGCGVAGSADAPAAGDNPNAGLLRDFLDGKFDSAGHPLNAKVITGEALCGAQTLTQVCTSTLPAAATAQHGSLAVNLHLRADGHPASGAVVTVQVYNATKTLAYDTLTVDRLRGDEVDFALTWDSDGGPAYIQITPAAPVDLAYAEVFPSHIGVVIDPGSGVVADADHLTIEVPRTHALDAVVADATAIDPASFGTRTATALRTVIDVEVGALLPDRGDVVELHLNAGADAARAELRRTPPACHFEGTGATRVLITGFQAFPADGWHDNVSGVAVSAVEPARVSGAQIMRLVLPVEYDRAAAEVADAIARCAPDVVISFGQGGDAIALEHTAYNLQDTGEVPGGVPDNRGIVRVAQPIDPAGPAERATQLPVDAIERALVALGEAPQHSTDPGRYICNNVMYQDVAHMAGRGRAGFIHLPYTTTFDAATRARFARVVEAAIRATLAN